MNTIGKDAISFAVSGAPQKEAVTVAVTDAKKGVVVEKTGPRGLVEVDPALITGIIEVEQVLAEDTLQSGVKVHPASASDLTGLLMTGDMGACHMTHMGMAGLMITSALILHIKAMASLWHQYLQGILFCHWEQQMALQL